LHLPNLRDGGQGVPPYLVGRIIELPRDEPLSHDSVRHESEPHSLEHWWSLRDAMRTMLEGSQLSDRL